MKLSKTRFEGVFRVNGKLATKNLTPGKKVYGEQLFKVGKTEYREWVPERSKPAAAIKNGLKNFPLKEGIKILYLGIASGTTASHISDIIGKDGVIYGVEISERSIRDLNPIAEQRGNIVPVLANAKLPEQYAWIEQVDLVFADVATDDQSEVLIRNCKQFLKPSGLAMIAIKSRSIDVTKDPKIIYKQEEKKLSEHFKIVEKVILYPFEKDHCMFVVKWK